MAIGLSAEQIFLHLDLPRNDEANQRQCVCSSDTRYIPSARECTACFVYAPISGSYRRPDFVSPTFIGEAKNTSNLLYSQNDRVDQISDEVSAARQLGIPLYLFVRVNTLLSPDFYALVELTGGGVVNYFTVQGVTSIWSIMRRESAS